MIDNIYRIDLPNGIRCIHRRVQSGVTYCTLTVNSGSRDESAKKHGVAHLIEHSLFKGTKRREAWEINCRLENSGGELNAFTTKEETVIHATTLRQEYAKAVELIADIVFRATFPEEEIEREKEVILDEISISFDSPSEVIFDDFEELIFDGSSLAHTVLGTGQMLRKLRRRDIVDFVGRTYTTDQIVFSSTGNLSREQFERIMRRYLGELPASTRNFARIKPPEVQRFSISADKDAFQSHCLLGAVAYDMHDPRRTALSLLMNTLGGPAANSILNVVLREQNALTYSVEAEYAAFSDTGLATIYFGAEKDKVNQCIDLINRELSIVRKDGLTARQLAVAKRQYIGQMAIALENNEGHNLSMGRSLLVYNDIESPDAIRRRIEAIDGNDVRQVANEVLGNLSMLIFN